MKVRSFQENNDGTLSIRVDKEELKKFLQSLLLNTVDDSPTFRDVREFTSQLGFIPAHLIRSAGQEKAKE